MSSSFVNRTIDDQYGDEITGKLVTYTPSIYWTQGNNCGGCSAKPDPLVAVDGTWHDGSRDPARTSETVGITFSFNGTAVYVFNILVRGVTTDVNVTLDGQFATRFNVSGGPDEQYSYNETVFAREGLPYGEHTVEVVAGGPDYTLMLFDYALYTTNQSILSNGTSSSSTLQPTPSPSPSSGTPAEKASSHVQTGAIAGGVVGGVVFLIGLLILLYFACRRSRTSRSRPPIVPFLGKRRPHMTEVLRRESPGALVDEEKDVNDSTQAVRLPKGYFPPPPGTGTSSDMDTLTPPSDSTNPPTEIEERRPFVQSETEPSLEETVRALRAELQALQAASAGRTGVSRSTTSGIPSFINITSPRPTDSSTGELQTKQASPAQAGNRTMSTLALEMQALRAEVTQLRRHQQGSESAPRGGTREPVEAEAGLAREVAALRAEVEEMRVQQQLERGTLPSYSPPTRPIPGIPFVGPVVAT